MVALLIADEGRKQQHAAAARQTEDRIDHLLRRLARERTTAVDAVRSSNPGKQQSQIIVDFGNGADG